MSINKVVQKITGPEGEFGLETLLRWIKNQLDKIFYQKDIFKPKRRLKNTRIRG